MLFSDRIHRSSSRLELPLRWLVPLTVLAVTFGLMAWYYVALRSAFFDDVFIYLHIARNGADHGTWQYFTVVDRPALLASSPIRIVLLTVATKLSALVGFGERTFANAKLVLVIYAPLAWAIWYPFWQERKMAFVWLGVVYFLSPSLSLFCVSYWYY